MEEIPQTLNGIAIDVMIANMGEVLKGKPGGPLTMNLEMLKKLHSELKPAVTVPIHNDDYSHYFPVEKRVFVDCGFCVIDRGAWTVL